MAVVQISRIQVRRGKSLAGTGLPQLASGELAWSLDTQELYIGNGSISEGSPAVGNTKILTERDLTVQGNLLNLIQHIYKANDPAIQTGPTPNDPTSRQTQERLDDRVTVADFGTVSDGTVDDTLSLQRAIDQLFLNPSSLASSADSDGVRARIILDLGPGIYKITDTLYIPSYATLIGAGADKTILSYSGTGPAIQFVNDSSTIGSPSTIGNTLSNTQPRHIVLKGLTISTATDDQTGIQLDAVRDSYFDDVVIQGNWLGNYDVDSKGISMQAVSELVTCSNNIFSNIAIRGFSHAVYAKQDILNNSFTDCYITDVRQGFVLGDGANGTTVGQQYGPRETQIIRCKFDDVKRHAVYVDRGTGNTTRDCKLTNVGNDGSGVYFPEYPQIYFGSVGNTSQNDQSDREVALSSLSFTVQLTLNKPITASKGALVVQAGTNVQGTLKEDYDSDSVISVVTKYTTPFGNLTSNILTIDGDILPGDSTTVVITGSNTTQYTTDSSITGILRVGTVIRFNGVMGGVVAATDYYVESITSSNTFKISNTLGGIPRPLSASTGSMIATFQPTVHPTVVGSLTIVPYIPEVAGYVTYKSYATRQIQLGYITSPSLVTTLPISTDENGSPVRSVSYKIDYMYRSANNSFTRHGTLSLVVDVDASIAANSTRSRLTDDYTITGISESDALLLDFSTVLLNETGAAYSGLGQIPASIALRYTNLLSNDTGFFSYSYTVIL